MDPLGNIHVDWMNGLDNGATQRHIYYNLRDTSGVWQFGSVGQAVESAQRGGYCVIGADSDGRPFPSFHVIRSGNPRAHSAVAADLFPGSAAFDYWDAPYVEVGGQDIQVIWPQIAIDHQGRIQVFDSQEMANAGDPMALFYVRGIFDDINLVMNYSSRTFVDTTMTISATIGASRITDRVAIAWMYRRPTYGGVVTQLNNDVYAVISEDGVNWDFENPINITNFIPPDLSLLPDTIAADKDTLRSYDDISLFFDEDDVLHAAFTTPAFYEIEGLVSINNSLIWHWAEDTEFYSLVADGWWGAFAYPCGGWQRFAQRPCLSQDPSTGYLYCLYQAYDTSDVSAGGFPQGELYVSVSTDNGVRWSVGTNITNTHAPNAAAGQCLSERDPSMNEIVDGYLRILYVLDTDAGGIPQNEGAWTLSQVIYQETAATEIPTTPLMPIAPMHVDSTGIPVSVPMVENDKLPSNFRLEQNYPNPFNPTTNIRFDLTHADRVSLKVYNIVGQEAATLVDGTLMAGQYEVSFDGSDLASGVYFYRLTSAAQTETCKMVLLK